LSEVIPLAVDFKGHIRERIGEIDRAYTSRVEGHR
jgi:hypothetical protein